MMKNKSTLSATVFVTVKLMFVVLFLAGGILRTNAQSVSVNPGQLCPGAAATATATPSPPFLLSVLNYEWSLNGTFFNTTTTNVNSFPSNLLNIGNNNVSVKINYGLYFFGIPIIITFDTENTNLLLKGIIGGSSPLCVGTTTQLTGNGTAINGNPWSSNNMGVATVSSAGLVTGISAGTATITYKTSNNCNVTKVITVAANGTITLSSGSSTNDQTTCVNTTLSPIRFSTTGATGATAIGLPAGVSGNWAANVYTISGTPTVSGSFPYTVSLTGTCGNKTTAGIITVNPNTTVSAASISPTVCFNTTITPITHTTTGAAGISNNGVAGVNGLPAGISATWAGNVITISGTPTASGTFNYSIPLTGGCGAVNATGTITVGEVTTYNGSWNNGSPDITKNAVFKSDFSTSGNMVACNCEVNNGATLTIKTGTGFTVQNNIINNGAILVESEGNLVQNNDYATNTGNITVKRNASMKRLDYTYWGSPVTGQNLKNFTPGTVNSRFLTYNEADDYFYAIDPINNVFGNSSAGTFESAAKGYAIRANNSYPVWTNPAEAVYTSFEGKFTGAPHNGVIEFPLKKAGNGYNLVGNPYASNIDFHTLEATGAIEGVAYFWTNANPTPATQEGSGYSGLNYATYTVLSGGTAAFNSNKKPERYIKVGQGFIVKATAAGNLTFNNAMRNNGSGASTFINKAGNSKAEVTDRFWLRLTTPSQNFNTILIAYPEGATNGFESNADAKALTASSDAFYSVMDDQTNLVIQGRAFPFPTTDKVALGMNGYEAGNYTISLSEKEGVFASGQHVYLKDKQTGIVANLSEGNYTFTANKGITEGRFDIVYQSETVLATDATLKDELVVYRDGNDFIVKAQSKKITDIEVFDATGRLVFKKLYNNTNVVVPSDQLSNGMYILKISQGEQTTTKKILR